MTIWRRRFVQLLKDREEELEKLIKKIVVVLPLSITDEKVTVLCEFIKFGLVGISNTVISYVAYVVCVYVGIHYFGANAIGFVISVLNSFYWNNKYVFTCQEGQKRSWLPALLKTFVSYGTTGIVLASLLLYLWVDVLGISEYLAPLLNLIITIPLNFVLNKLWAFKTKDNT